MFRKLVKYALVFLFFAVVLDPTLRSWIGPSYDLTLRSIRTTFDDLVKSAPPHPVHARTPGKRPRVLTAKKINAKKARRLIVDKARSMEGTRYFFGGETAFGVDCSGLVVVSYRAAGIQLPHSSRLLSRLGRPVRLDALLPGDLAFFQTSRGRTGHVGIILGKGLVVHASSSRSRVVIEPLSTVARQNGYTGARRILGLKPSS